MIFIVLTYLLICAFIAALVGVVPATFLYFGVRRVRPPRMLWLAVIPWLMFTFGMWRLWRSSLDDKLVHEAAVGDDAEVVRLLDRGVDPNHGDGEGRLALVAASAAGDTTMISLLVRSGAEVNRPERVGEAISTPLEAACAMMMDRDTLYVGRDAGRPCAHAEAAAHLRRLGAR